MGNRNTQDQSNSNTLYITSAPLTQKEFTTQFLSYAKTGDYGGAWASINPQSLLQHTDVTIITENNGRQPFDNEETLLQLYYELSERLRFQTPCIKLELANSPDSFVTNIGDGLNIVENPTPHDCAFRIMGDRIEFLSKPNYYVKCSGKRIVVDKHYPRQESLEEFIKHTSFKIKRSGDSYSIESAHLVDHYIRSGNYMNSNELWLGQIGNMEYPFRFNIIHSDICMRERCKSGLLQFVSEYGGHYLGAKEGSVQMLPNSSDDTIFNVVGAKDGIMLECYNNPGTYLSGSVNSTREGNLVLSEDTTRCVFTVREAPRGENTVMFLTETEYGIMIVVHHKIESISDRKGLGENVKKSMSWRLKRIPVK